MAGARLIGGGKGLKNEVLRVSVMEVADFHSYSFETGLFLLSTFSCFQNNHRRMAESFAELADKRLSGILLKLHRFIEDIPPELIEIADRKGVPLLVTEENIKFRDAIFYIISNICNDQMASAVLYELVFSRQTDEEHVAERLRMLGFAGDGGYCVISLQPEPGAQLMQAPLRRLFPESFPGGIIHPLGSGFIGLVPTAALPQSRRLRGVKRGIEELLAALPEKGLRAGCSRERLAFTELDRAYAEAKRSVSYGRLAASDSAVHLYDDFFEFEMIAHIRGTEEHRRIDERVISAVSEYDAKYSSELWASLAACLAGKTLKDAAETLCIHISTLRYRLGKLQEITGLDYFIDSERYILRTAYILSIIGSA